MGHTASTPRERAACDIHLPQFRILLARVQDILAEHIVSSCCFARAACAYDEISYSETRMQLTRFIADRTGIISIANVPVLWLFATRNDPLLWLTGWSFATYNRFHRWVARVATVQAVVHSIAYSVYMLYVGPGAFEAEWIYRYWWTGEVVSL